MADISSAASNVGATIRANSKVLVVALIFVAIGGFIVAYILYWAITKVALSKELYLVPETKSPILATSEFKSAPIKVPTASNGKRASYTFWIYVNDIQAYSGSPRRVLYIGDGTVVNASPIVYFSRTDNKLHVCFSPASDADLVTTDVPNLLDYLTAKYGITIDYIPIQRWVHVAVVVNETINGGTISAYLDAELVKVVTTGKSNSITNQSTRQLSIQNLVLDKSGSLYIGGSPSDSSKGPGFSGLVSRFTVYNYDINVSDIYADYKIGPVDNILAKLGLGAYGVRSPLYRIA